jgi:hypothetical protein
MKVGEESSMKVAQFIWISVVSCNRALTLIVIRNAFFKMA